MTPLDVLFAVRGLLAQPERWFKGGLARNIEGSKVSVTHPHACCFTLDGAFVRIQYITQAPSVGRAYAILKRAIDPSNAVLVASFNDARGTTHWTVTQMLDRAIRLAGGVPLVVEEQE